ncbi:MAG: alpha/beta hydrolase fold domain-containing protein [Pseudomonadota bacterium]
MPVSNRRPSRRFSPAAARRNPTIADAVNVLLRQRGHSTNPKDLVPEVTSLDILVDGAAGQLPARVYTPSNIGPFTVVVYFHGGGWVLADKDVYDGGARGLCHAARALVFSVDYRLAPDHKFPAAWLDAFAAYRWVLANAHRYGGDPAAVGARRRERWRQSRAGHCPSRHAMPRCGSRCMCWRCIR